MRKNLTYNIVCLGALATLCLGASADAQKKLSAKELAVYDPQKTVSSQLQTIQQPFTALANLETLSPATEILVVGANSLDEATSTSAQWNAWTKRGVRIIVLEQSWPYRPLHGDALPENTWLAEQPSAYEMGANSTHPLFQGVTAEELKSWNAGQDEFVPLYGLLQASAVTEGDPNIREGFKTRVTPTNVVPIGSSAVSPLYTPVVVVTQGQGVQILSQLPVGARLSSDSLARRLFNNLLTFAQQFKPSSSSASSNPVSATTQGNTP